MNYNFDRVFTNIEDFRKEYPDPKNPEIAARFKSLEEYLVMAKKVIKTFGPQCNLSKYDVHRMANSENAVSEIARHLMMADWRWKENGGRKERSYRNQCGLWAIQDYLNLFKTKASKENYSLDIPVGDSEGSLSTIIEDVNVDEPDVVVNNVERKERVKKYIRFLIDNSKLSKIQKKCIELKYLEGVESYVEIGKRFQPPISRQATKQNIDRAIYKIKQTALGTLTDQK